ncbi:MAG: ABC transporter substrate-binding protein [Syntrophorhabdus sp.]|jgi:branched-chain amino acid transport system substrate-binding protein|nr:ABC transporter substrate-binding protein [Syntrophorhabdus sp.]HOD79030.1 ABC transporter substrate-binding protein [Syntrophorhabdus sp.]HQG26667.1 ABC transporter substrate-binding protein [Syntrophorhabdus sp.]HQH83891.1 ABC transporter substrate-binding protein [Syntrophorhabdus sp.]
MQLIAKRQDGNELLVGGIFSLTGYLSWSGDYKKKGAELKIEMINEAGGINGNRLKLVAYDDRSSPELAAKIAEMLVLKHRVIAMVGTGSLPISGAVARVANKYKVPTFLNSGYTIDPLSDLFVFNTSHKTEFAVAGSFGHFVEKGINRIALLMPRGPLGDLGSWLGRQVGRELGIKIVGEERFDVSVPEMTSQLERLKSLKPLALFSFVTGEPAARLVTKMAQLGMNISLLVSHGNANPAFLKLVSRAPIPIIVPSGRTMILDSIPEEDPCRNKMTDFGERHTRRFGEPANYCSAESADAIDLLAEGLRSSGRPDGRILRDAVEAIKQFEGMQGVYDLSPIDHYGTQVEHMVLLDVQDGIWHLTKRLSSVGVFEAIHSDNKKRLVFRLARAFNEPSTEALKLAYETPGSTRRLAAQVGLSCTNLKGDPCFAVKLSSREKQELIQAIREEDYTKAKESLCRSLTISLLQYYEAFEPLKLAVSELFHALFDAAASEEGVDLEKLIELKSKYVLEWTDLKDQEALCFWTVKAFREVIELISERQRERGTGLLKNILRFIEIHFAENLTVDRIAREVCLSPSRLIHRMKSQYGLTLSDCIAKTRMDKAKALLKDTDMTICEIAHEVGYVDQGYFTRVFKKCLNKTPGNYRESSRLGFPSNRDS